MILCVLRTSPEFLGIPLKTKVCRFRPSNTYGLGDYTAAVGQFRLASASFGQVGSRSIEFGKPGMETTQMPLDQAMPVDRAVDEVSDADRDALHTMPIAMVPMQTPALRRARLIKNSRLNGVVELFADHAAGSGQIGVEDVPNLFDWEEGPRHPDLILLRKLAGLTSYDIYSLRVLLREADIAVNEHESLRLSESKVNELNSYMTKFTRPLIGQIFGNENVEIKTFEDILDLFRNPDVKHARTQLQLMADKLAIKLSDIPRFLEDYGDIMLSLSYYRQCLDEIEPIITEFLNCLQDLRGNFQLREDKNLMTTCRQLESMINELMAAITGRFENFDRSTATMWDDISALRFQKVKELITSYHTTIGGVLCALTVKMSAWHDLFPNESAGGPMKRAEFIMADMRQGMDNIQQIENSAPMLSELN